MGVDDRIFRLPKLCLGLQKLGLQNVGLNPGEHLAFFDEISLIHQNVRHAAGHLCRNIDLRGLDAAVATGKILAKAGSVLPGHSHGKPKRAMIDARIAKEPAA